MKQSTVTLPREVWNRIASELPNNLCNLLSMKLVESDLRVKYLQVKKQIETLEGGLILEEISAPKPH